MGKVRIKYYLHFTTVIIKVNDKVFCVDLTKVSQLVAASSIKGEIYHFYSYYLKTDFCSRNQTR